ncbi:MAG: sigma-70 family RNA polymerase sigma factor [Pseudomonadota bacterium]
MKALDRTETSLEDDAMLVRAFQAGNKASFDELVLRHKDRIFNLCYRFLGDYEEANDCAQEAFVKAFRSAAAFRFESAFATWLYRIAVNTCKNRLRSLSYRLRKRMLRLGEPESENDLGACDPPDGAPGPATKLECKESETLIQKAIEMLPADQRAVILLRHLDGLSYEDIVAITGYNVGTVKSKLSRARNHLKDSLKEVI